MREGPPTGETPYVWLGILLAGTGGAGMMMAVSLGLRNGVFLLFTLAAGAGLFLFEMTRRLWGGK